MDDSLQSGADPEGEGDIGASHHSIAARPAFLAWHYTTGAPYLQIIKQHELLPRPVSHPDGNGDAAKPIVWFSVKSDFDPSACPMVHEPDGSVRQFSVAETSDQGLGLVRLGLPVRMLLTCNELRRKAGIADDAWFAMFEEAKARGSDPDEWFGCLGSVPLGDLTVEVRDERGFWRRVQSGVSASCSLRPETPTRQGTKPVRKPPQARTVTPSRQSKAEPPQAPGAPIQAA